MKFIITCSLLLVAALAVRGDARATPPPAGVPTLEEMAGEWLPSRDVANYPDVHNFNQMFIVGPDLTSFYCNPGGLFARVKGAPFPWMPGYPLVTMTVDGAEYPAAEMRWSAYRALRRNADCHGLSVETDARMVNEQRGVLCRVTATNNAAKPAKAAVTLRVPGVLQPDGVGVSNGTQRKNCVSVLRPSRKPDSVTTGEGVVCWNWTLDLPAGGKAAFGYVAGDEKSTASAETDARVAGWAARFDATMDECQRVWEQRWADAFTPGNTHFSGSLPVLATDHPALARNYYMGALTMLILERTQFPVTPRDFITSGERGDGIQYYWDASMQATAWALLEPAGLKATLRRWLVQNPRSGAHTSTGSAHGFDEKHYDTVTGYAFNACTIFKTADAYLRLTGDHAFLDEKLENGKTVLDQMDAFATDWETLPRGPHDLVDYGKNGNLLECAPEYVNCVASLNAQNVWMMRQTAQWHRLHGEAARAQELQGKAASLLPAVLGLYKSGDGVWNAYHLDGKLVDLRHCVDFIYVGDALAPDLNASQKSEMNAFVKRELLARDWMRAMSWQDASATHSNRPDHSPTGAYDGWIPLTVGAMWRLGASRDAFDFYCRTAVVTKEGPFAQAREFYGPDIKAYDAAVRIALRGGCMKECISGAAFTDVVLRTFFGFDPSADGKTPLADPTVPRPFQGRLENVRRGDKMFTIAADQDGVRVLAR